MKDAVLGVRWLVFLFGLWVMTVGIGVSVKSGLGTSPISTVPAVLVNVVPLSFGVITVLMNWILVVLQILMLGKRFTTINYLQFLIAIVFGTLCDASLMMLDFLNPTTYLQQWILVIIGAALVALGVFTEVMPRLVYVPGEGVVAALSLRSGWRFGTVKQCVDWSLVISAAILSLVFLGCLEGAREGTVFAAFAVGGLVKLYRRIWDDVLAKRAGKTVA